MVEESKDYGSEVDYEKIQYNNKSDIIQKETNLLDALCHDIDISGQQFLTPSMFEKPRAGKGLDDVGGE